MKKCYILLLVTIPFLANSQCFTTQSFTSGGTYRYTPTSVGKIEIMARGADGGNSNDVHGGPGAFFTADFTVLPGDTIIAYVGYAGAAGTAAAGGGGATGIVLKRQATYYVLMVAGAGGGGGKSTASGANVGSYGLSTSQGSSGTGTGGPSIAGGGGGGGYTGAGTSNGTASDGKGGAAASVSLISQGGAAGTSGGVGGIGFGGGGGGGTATINCFGTVGTLNGGGGGGGYTGGNGAYCGGNGAGGTSYIIADNSFVPTLISASSYSYGQAGNAQSGAVTISCIQSLCTAAIASDSIRVTIPAANCAYAILDTVYGLLPSGGNGSYTYTWQVSTDSINYTSSTGSPNGNYYLYNDTIKQTTWYKRIVNSGYCNALTSNLIKIAVYPLPPAPVITAGGNTAICPGSSVQLSSSINTGNQWLNNNAPVNTATQATYTATAAGSYSARVTDTHNCVSAPATAIAVTLQATPVITLAATGCVNNTLKASVNNTAFSLVWKLGTDTVKTSAAGYNPNGVTVAGGNGFGIAANQLGGPYNIFIDTANNLFVAETQNARVKKFAAGSTTGVIVAGTGSGGGTILTGPKGIFVDKSGNLFVSDNNSVLKFAPGSNVGVVVAGGNGVGNTATRLQNPAGIFVDTSGNLFIADASNSRVQKFPPGSNSGTSGITVAGGNGAGTDPSQVFDPWGVFVDKSGNLFVAENGSGRVQKYAPGNTTGVIVVSAAVSGITGIDPVSVFVDTSGNLFVADAYTNGNRIWEFAADNTPGRIVAGGNGVGSGATQFTTLVGIGLDKTGNLYAVDAGNYRIQKFLKQSLDTTYKPTATGSFTLMATAQDGCSSTQSITVQNCSLPVQWFSFTAAAQNNNTLLNWQTTTEINNDYFMVQRSIDGTSFTAIATIKAAGNSSTIQSYNYTDDNISQWNANKLYYRLQSVDKDGAYTYSDIVAVTIPQHEWNFTIAPNPVHNNINMQINSLTAQATIHVLDMAGRILLSKTITANNGQPVTLDASSLTAGMYIIRVQYNGQTKEQKLIKQ